MKLHRTNAALAVYLAAALLIVSAGFSQAMVVDFSGVDAGTIVSNANAGGGTSTSNVYPGFALACINLGGGPNAIIVMDSHYPTGDDDDLGTPNQAFGGPGIGSGGAAGPGQNDRALGNLLIIAENSADGNGDGLVDDPDDEAGGGVVTFMFDQASTVHRVVVLDIDDDEACEVRLYNGSMLLMSTYAAALGNNSVQTLNLGSQLGVTHMEVYFTSSGAIGEIEFTVDTTPVEESTWGIVKAIYQN